MMPDQLERNLLLFLDPYGEVNVATWRFVKWRRSGKAPIRPASETDTSVISIYCFDRIDIIGYFRYCRYVKTCGLPYNIRKVLFIDDGLLSSFFDADKTEGYRAFSSNHLPSATSLRQRLVRLLPLVLRAEKRYLIIGHNSTNENAIQYEVAANLTTKDFMFFSNAGGKLLLTSAETLHSGQGLVAKTTSCSAYVEVMEKEFSTMLRIAEIQGESASLPDVGKRFQFGNRIFYTESYVKGKSLRDVLHMLSCRNNIPEICAYLDRLDIWFEKYRAAFRGEPLHLALCYRHLFEAFSGQYGEHPKAGVIEEMAREAVKEIAGKHVFIVPITAHNDLWPGNMVVGDDGLVAIDWERAVENRAPLFDYYWMIISSALEYFVCKIGSVDYSRAFRLFLFGGDTVARHAVEVLNTFLLRLGLDRNMHQNFMLLFLMEWSVQGYLALGCQTDMDRVAFGELVTFIESSNDGKFS